MLLAEISGRRCGEEAGKLQLFANRKSLFTRSIAPHVPRAAAPAVWVGHSCPTLLNFHDLPHTRDDPSFASFAKEPALSGAEGCEPQTLAQEPPTRGVPHLSRLLRKVGTSDARSAALDVDLADDSDWSSSPRKSADP